MRKSLTLVRERILTALKAVCAGAPGTLALVDELIKVDAQIEDEHERDRQEHELAAANNRDLTLRTVEEVRAILAGGRVGHLANMSNFKENKEKTTG